MKNGKNHLSNEYVGFEEQIGSLELRDMNEIHGHTLVFNFKLEVDIYHMPDKKSTHQQPAKFQLIQLISW